MAGSPSEKTSPDSGAWRQILAGGGLVAAVGTVLILAAVLETPKAPARPQPQPPVRASKALPPSSSGWQSAAGPSSLVVVNPPPDEGQIEQPVLDALSRRALEDPARIRKRGGIYTAQLAFACRRETAQRLLDRSGASSDLYVLPEVRDGQDCFRLCWGSFASREEALRLQGLPADLRDGLGKPEAKRIEELVQ